MSWKCPQVQRNGQSHVPLALGVCHRHLQQNPRKRTSVVDCRASMHMLSRKEDTKRVSRNPTTVITANGEAHTNKEATVYRFGFIRDSTKPSRIRPRCCLLEHSVKITDVPMSGQSGQEPHLVDNGRKMQCKNGNRCTDRCPRIVYRLFQFQRPYDVEVHAVQYRGDQFRSSETSKDDNKDIDPVQGNLLRGLPEWLEDFTEIPVDGGVSASRCTPASNSHESDLERPAKNGVEEAQYLYSSPKTEVAKRAREPRLQGLFAGNALEQKTLITEERYAELRKELLRYWCNQAWMKNGGLIPWHAIAICKMYRTSYQTGKHLMKRDLENHAKIEYHRHISAEDQSRHHQFGKKVLPGMFLGHALFARGIWKGDFLVADIEELDMLDASDIHARRLNARGNNAQKRVNKFFTDRRWNSKIVWKKLWSPRIHSKAETTCKEWRCQRRTSRKLGNVSTDRRTRNDFWLIEGGFIYRHHVEPRVQLYVPEEESFPIPLKYIDVTRTHTNLDVLQECRIDDHWNVDVDWNLSDSWTGFTKFTLLNEETLQRDTCVPGVRLTKIQSHYQTWFFVAWHSVLRVISSEGEAGMGCWKLENTPFQKHRKSWKFRWRRQCLAGWEQRSAQVGCGNPRARPQNPTQRQSMHASWKLMHPRSTKRYWGSHRGKKVQFDTSLQFSAQVCCDAPSDEISGCESSSGGRMGEARKVASVAIEQGKNGRQLGPTLKTQLFLFELKLHGHPLSGLLWERHFQKVLLGQGWEEVPLWECIFLHRMQQGLFLSVYVDDKKWLEEGKTSLLCGRNSSNNNDLGEPTSYRDHVYMGCTQRECKSNESILDEHRQMFESRISARATENVPGWETSHAKTIAWSYDMEGHAKKCVKRHCELASKTTLCTMHWRPSLQKETVGNGGRVVKSMLSKFPKMSTFGANW